VKKLGPWVTSVIWLSLQAGTHGQKRLQVAREELPLSGAIIPAELGAIHGR
jgi:hypothetical protein